MEAKQIHEVALLDYARLEGLAKAPKGSAQRLSGALGSCSRPATGAGMLRDISSCRTPAFVAGLFYCVMCLWNIII